LYNRFKDVPGGGGRSSASLAEPHSEDELRAQLVETCRLLQSRYLIRATGGNVSARLAPGEPIFITASGFALAEITTDHLVKLSPDGGVLTCPDGLRASNETLPHLAIHRACNEARCVVHVHPPYATAYACAGIEIPLVTITAEALIRRTPVVPVVESGTERLSAAIEQAIHEAPDARCLLLKNHGLMLWEATPRKAFHLAELIEECAQTAWIRGQIG